MLFNMILRPADALARGNGARRETGKGKRVSRWEGKGREGRGDVLIERAIVSGRATAESDRCAHQHTDQAALYRSGMGIMLYVAPDRADIQFAVSELTRLMKTPTERGMAIYDA